MLAPAPAPANKPAARPVPAESAPRKAAPANGPELQRRLYEHDQRLAKEGVCKPGELVKHIVAAGQKAGYEGDLSSWSGAAIRLAIDETRAFVEQCKQEAVPRKEVA